MAGAIVVALGRAKRWKGGEAQRVALARALGLAVSVLVVLAAMPLLNRITRPENARFE